MADQLTVFVVDDDPDVRQFLERLVATRGWKCVSHETAQSFLDNHDPKTPGCLILDIGLPGMSGLELQRELADRRIQIPIIMLTGTGDIASAREAFRNGVVDFVQKPFRNNELLDCIDRALQADARLREQRAIQNDARERFGRLTPREREVVDLMVEGKTTKEIAFALSLSPKTVDVHRANGLRKMGIESVAELVRLSVALNAEVGLVSPV